MCVKNDPRRVALNVSGAALLLAGAKAAVGVASGSLAVLSSALDSAGDALASFVNFVFLTVAAKPADDDHQFGHGKAEYLAALLQGLLLLGSAVVLGIRAFHRIADPRPVAATGTAIVAMLVSIAATIAIARYLDRNAVRAESSALAGDALHYTSDILANGGTIAALVLVKWTGIARIDSIFGVSVAAWIAWNSLFLIWNAANDLMDAALPREEVDKIVAAIERSDPAVVGYRELRTRRAAGVRFIEFELCIDRRTSFEHAHLLTESVKTAIQEHFPRTVVTIHAEPVAPR